MAAFLARVRGLFHNEELAKADAQLDAQLDKLASESLKLDDLNSRLDDMRKSSDELSQESRNCHHKLQHISSSSMKAVRPDDPKDTHSTPSTSGRYRQKLSSSAG